jgi:hypothetical protein
VPHDYSEAISACDLGVNSSYIFWYGRQSGTVDAQRLQVGGEAAATASKRAGREQESGGAGLRGQQHQPRLGARMLDIVMRGVSTRQYRSVVPSVLVHTY